MFVRGNYYRQLLYSTDAAYHNFDKQFVVLRSDRNILSIYIS